MVTPLAGAFLFGSAARGDVDHASDTDVLLVYDRPCSATLRSDTQAAVSVAIGRDCSFAEYSCTRLLSIFDAGHLFAWHLHYEARPLRVPGLDIPEPFVLGVPRPYTTAAADAGNFLDLLGSVVVRCRTAGVSQVYESGLAYLALRNIGISLSSVVLQRPSFTRWAPFEVAEELGLSPPCTKATYDRLAAARHASQRGFEPPTLDPISLFDELQQAQSWASLAIGLAHERTAT